MSNNEVSKKTEHATPENPILTENTQTSSDTNDVGLDSANSVQRETAPPERRTKSNDGSFKSDKVIVGKNESIDSVLRRFKRQSSEIISEAKRRQVYIKPSVEKKNKQEEAQKKNRSKRNSY